ncbi:MAG: ATP-binding protein [Polyangiaceae bacterium]
MSELATFLSNRRANVIEMFVARLRQSALAPEDLPKPILIDGLPRFFDALVHGLERLDAPTVADADAKTASSEHGEQRWDVGFDLTSVVREYGVLEGCILDAIAGSDIVLGVRETAVIARAINEGIAHAVKAFTDESHEALRREHARAEALLLRAPLAAAIVRGTDHVFDVANPAFVELVGGNDPSGKPFREALPSFRGQGFEELLDRVYRRRSRFDATEVLVTLANDAGTTTQRYVNFVLESLVELGSEDDGVVIFGYDVTAHVLARVRAETLARELADQQLAVAMSESRLRFMTESIPQLVFTVLPDGRADYFNARWTEYTGMTDVESFGDGWMRALHPDDLARTEERSLDVRTSGADYEVEYRLRAKDGTYRWFLARAAALRDATGSVMKWFDTCTDVDDVKRVTAELEREREERRAILVREQALRLEAERTNRLKDEFLANVSHELRTPLQSIMGWARLLRHDELGRDQFKKGLETIERNARSQSQLVEDILDVSRIVAGKVRLNLRTVSLRRVITQAVDTVRPAADARNVVIETSLHGDTGRFLGDEDRLQQVIWNLLSNAVKFSPKGGRVRVSLVTGDTECVVCVEDEGRGIAEDFLPFVFVPFRQAEGGITRSQGGLGLGLSIVKHILELHGGTIAVESEGLGKGARFTVRLPLREQETDSDSEVFPVRARPAPEEGASPSIPGVRILVVDDEDDARELLVMALERSGARVDEARSVADALERIEASTPDVIVSDIGMPGEDGYILVQRLRALPADHPAHAVPAVALTAYARNDDRRRALAAGFQTHVAKPIDPAELVRVVAGLLPSKN